MDCFPDDILTQIFCKVQIQCSKSILRCTSVSKPWYSLIKSPAFINFHMHCPDKPKYLLCYYQYSYYRLPSLSILHDTETLVEHNRLGSFKDLGYGMSVHGCCTGLICYTKSSNGVTYLWNPTIRKQKALPRYRDHGNACYGFWFDKRVNDYMVAEVKGGLSFGIYSLSTNFWKTIPTKIPYNLVDELREIVYVDGTLHWLVPNYGGWMICSLDTESGLFKKTMLTETTSIPLHRNKYFSLKPLGEHSFAVVESTTVSLYEAMCCCTVHVYDQNVNRLYTVDLEKDARCKLHMAGLRNNGEALFAKLNFFDSGLISWNSKTNEIKEFALAGSYPPYPNYRLFSLKPFVETLVLLNDGNAEGISSRSHHLKSKSNFACFIWLVFLGLTSLIVLLVCFLK